MKPDFSIRSNEPEQMDDLSIGGQLIEQTLDELDIINKWLGGNYVTLNGIKKIINQEKDRVYKIVDIGCGGGEMLRLIANWARKKKLKVELLGIDANQFIVEIAEKNSQKYPEISFKAINIFSEEFRAIECDILTATLFTHHFTDEELINLFSQFAEQSKIGIVINDIHRHWFAYHSIDWITMILSKSTMVQHDARLSVLRSFHKSDLVNILNKAGLHHFSIKWMWAFRWQVVVRANFRN